MALQDERNFDKEDFTLAELGFPAVASVAELSEVLTTIYPDTIVGAQIRAGEVLRVFGKNLDRTAIAGTLSAYTPDPEWQDKQQINESRTRARIVDEDKSPHAIRMRAMLSMLQKENARIMNKFNSLVDKLEAGQSVDQTDKIQPRTLRQLIARSNQDIDDKVAD